MQPSELEFVRLAGDASRVQPHIVAFTVPGPVSRSGLFDPDGDGLLNYDGFVAVHTGRLDTCTEIGETCAPIKLVNVPNVFGGFQLRSGLYHEFDVFFDGVSSGWISFPGFQP